MSSPYDILSRALADQFNEVSNPVNIGRDFLVTLRQLVRTTNKAFEQATARGDIVSHFVMDIDEAGGKSPLRPQPENSLVFFLSLYNTCTNDLKDKLVHIPEPSLLLRFHDDGWAECIATKKLLVDENAQEITISRSEKFRAHNQKGIETFVASWFRKNLDARTMVTAQDEIVLENENEESLLSARQIDRLNKLRSTLG